MNLPALRNAFIQKQKEMIFQEIRLADTTQLAPKLSETDLIQQLVSVARPQAGSNGRPVLLC